MGRTLDEIASSAKVLFGEEEIPRSEYLVESAIQLLYIDAVTFSGGNIWKADGFEVNVYTKDCTCVERSFRHEKWGKLCPHAVAVSMERKYRNENTNTTTTFDDRGKVVQKWTIGGILQKPGLISVWINYDYEKEEHHLVGLVDRGGEVRFPYREWVKIKHDQFCRALESSQFSVSGIPRKMRGDNYFYEWLLRSDKIGFIPHMNMWNTKSVTGSMIAQEEHKKMSHLTDVIRGVA